MSIVCGCDCAAKPSPDGYTGVSGDIQYNGTATCTGFNSGDINDFIEHITEIICNLNAIIGDLDFDTDDIGIGSLEPLCLEELLLNAENLTDVLNVIIAKICLILQTLNELEAGDIAIDIDFSCLGTADPTNLYEAIEYIRDYLCGLSADGEVVVPLKPHHIDGYTINDISAMGVARVRFSASSYWINQRYIDLLQTDIVLGNTVDNYIFIDRTTSDYNVTGVAIGDPAPATDGDVVAVVRTGIGTVITITPTLTDSPIDGTFIDDGSINIDKIDVAGTFGDSIQVGGGGLMEVETTGSLELDAVTGAVQLVNDELFPAANTYYGMSGAGLKGFHAMPLPTLNGTQVNIAAAAGSVTLAANYNVYNITATDGVDIDTAAGIGADVRRAVIRNATGGDITFVTGGTFNLDTDFVMPDGMCADILLRGGVVEIVVDFIPLDRALWIRGSGLESLQQVNTAAPNDASGAYAVAIGAATTASGDASHAQGFNTTASGESSHAQGSGTIASGKSSHAQGSDTIASGKSSHAQGVQTIASADASHAQGSGSTAYLYASHAHSSDAGLTERQTLRVTCGIATTDDTPTNCIIAIGEDITLRTNRAYTMRIIGQATTATGLVTSMSGECTATYDGADVVILQDTLAATYDGITIGGVQCVGGLVTDVFAIEVTGVAATAINWSFSVEWIEHKYTA